MTKSRKINKPRHRWTPLQLDALRARYADTQTIKVAETLGLTVYQVNRMAYRLGLKKTPEYLASPDACRLRRGEHVGKAYQYPKGHIPANKGVKGIRYPGCEATQFKPGQHPHTWMPLGSERYSKEGYLQRKMTDTGYPPRDWKGVHILLWVQHNGPVPQGRCVIFKDGDKRNIAITNLDCITRAENMKRNSVHNLPKELKDVLQLKGALNRRITCHERRNRTQKTPV